MQSKAAETMICKGGDFVLALKGDRKTLRRGRQGLDGGSRGDKKCLRIRGSALTAGAYGTALRRSPATSANCKTLHRGPDKHRAPCCVLSRKSVSRRVAEDRPEPLGERKQPALGTGCLDRKRTTSGTWRTTARRTLQRSCESPRTSRSSWTASYRIEDGPDGRRK